MDRREQSVEKSNTGHSLCQQHRQVKLEFHEGFDLIVTVTVQTLIPRKIQAESYYYSGTIIFLK